MWRRPPAMWTVLPAVCSALCACTRPPPPPDCRLLTRSLSAPIRILPLPPSYLLISVSNGCEPVNKLW